MATEFIIDLNDVPEVIAAASLQLNVGTCMCCPHRNFHIGSLKSSQENLLLLRESLSSSLEKLLSLPLHEDDADP